MSNERSHCLILFFILFLPFDSELVLFRHSKELVLHRKELKIHRRGYDVGRFVFEDKPEMPAAAGVPSSVAGVPSPR